MDALADAGKRFDMFHFAGHGKMTAEGGSLLLERADHRADAMSAEQLALTLRARGVRLAVLGACESGRRDNGRVWSGVAPALMKLGIGAAVAYQFPITDESAIVFAGRFYRAIAAGLGPDEAVSAGRLALMTAARGMDAEWGIPALYMRESDGKVFPELADDAALEPERKVLAIALEQRIKNLRGKLVGVQAREIRNGTVAVHQVITEVSAGANASGVEAKTIAGGEITVAQEMESVDEGGTVTGVTIGGED
jgi:CHAT domain-containing protein